MKKIYFERKQRGEAQNFCMRHKIGSDLIFKALELSRYFDDEVHRKPFFFHLNSKSRIVWVDLTSFVIFS